MILNVNYELEQYFLSSPIKIQQLIQAANIQAHDHVLELGAGIGSVAQHIPKCAKLTLVEIDSRLALHLQQNFPDADVLAQDALQVLQHTDCDVLICNLPSWLAHQVLLTINSKKPRISLLAIPLNDDYHTHKGLLTIKPLVTLDEQDFQPAQPFKAQIIVAY